MEGASQDASTRLDRTALSGAAWTGAAKWLVQLVAWVGTVVVARILSPDDYGLITMASVFLSALTILSEFGIGTAIIMHRELSLDELEQLNGFAILLGVVGSLVTIAASIPIGAFFKAPGLPPVVAALGVSFAITALQVVPGALLRRDLKFRVLAGIDVARGLLVPIVTLIGALLGLRYWALVLGVLAGALVTAVSTLVVRRVRVRMPSIAGLSHVLRFGRHMLVSRLAWIAYQDGDFAVAGRRLGQAGAGVYGLAWTIANSPLEKVSMVLSDVTPGLFSAVQHDRAALRRYFLNLSELLGLALFPVAAGLAFVSRDLVALLLGAKWQAAAVPISLLALYAGARGVTSLFGHLFTVARETRFLMWSSVLAAVVLVIGFIVGSRWGPGGIAAAWLVLHPSISVYSFTRVRRILDLSGAEYLRVLRLGLDGTVLMALVLLLFQTTLGRDLATLPRLLATVGLGGATFLAVTWLLHGQRLLQVLDWLRRMRGAAAPAAP